MLGLVQDLVSEHTLLTLLTNSVRHKCGQAGPPCEADAKKLAATQEQTQQVSEWTSKIFSLPSSRRGCHVMTREIIKNIPEIAQFECGLLNLFGTICCGQA